jgi:hypothetical protein
VEWRHLREVRQRLGTDLRAQPNNIAVVIQLAHADRKFNDRMVPV